MTDTLLPQAVTPAWEITKTGLRVNSPLDFDTWLQMTSSLIELRRRVSWALIDALLLGEELFSEEWTQILDIRQFSEQTMHNYRSLARAYPPGARYESLSVSHHDAVRSLPEPVRNEMLQLAVRNELGRNDLRDMAREYKQVASGHEDDSVYGVDAYTQARHALSLLTAQQVAALVAGRDDAWFVVEEVQRMLRGEAA